MIFDSHCHLSYQQGADESAEVRGRAAAAGVSLILDVGIDLATSRRARQHARELEGVHRSAGLHPNDCERLEDEWPEIEALCRESDCVAVGETGLDFYRDHTTPEQQQIALERHLGLATELDLPVIIHCRQAYRQVYEVLAAHAATRGVMHCFSAGVDEARAALELGFHLSFAGPLTYKNSDALRAAAAFAPADMILVETDAPFLPPQPWRGQRNEPAYIRATLETLATTRGVTFEQAARITTNNGRRLFGLAG